MRPLKSSRGRPDGGFLGLLQAEALIAVLAGTVGSIGLMLHAGRNAPRLLIVLFAIWVLSPFVALALANGVSKRWSVLTRATLYSVMLVVALGLIDVNYFCRLATTILAGPECGRGCDDPAAR